MVLPGKRAKERQRSNFVWIVLGIFFIISVFGLLIYTKINESKPNNAKTLCPASGPLGHTVLLVDKSDPLTFTQSKEFDVCYQEVVTKRVPKGHLLSVYALGDNFQETAEPIIELCNPGDGSDLSIVTGNPTKAFKDFQTKYVDPMMAKSSELVTTKPGKASPIMEMIQLVGITGFRKHDINGPKRLIIFSDMLQNTPQISMYKGIPKFSDFNSTPCAARTSADLPGVAVELQVFMHSPHLQNPQLLNFWEEYIFKARGKVILFNPIKG